MNILLKASAWERVGDVLVVVRDPAVQIQLEDPAGHAETLLSALAAGPKSLMELQQSLRAQGAPVTRTDLQKALQALDSLRLLANDDAQSLGHPALDDRFHSNLAFFDLFARLERPPAPMQQQLLEAHVLQLGTGGVGSNVLQHLSGLGIGRITLLDCDIVEPRNFARQYLYRHQDIGKSKVQRAAEWVRAFDPSIQVDVVERRVTGAVDLADLLAGVDVVSAAIDNPREVDQWVNEACMAAGVPYVRAGIFGSRLRYFSVDPGQSACLSCALRAHEEVARGTGVDAAASRLSEGISTINPAIGPAAGLLGAVVAFEIVRYLTSYEPPQAAGAPVTWDAGHHLAQRQQAWRADPDCRLCRHARMRRATAVEVVA